MVIIRATLTASREFPHEGSSAENLIDLLGHLLTIVADVGDVLVGDHFGGDDVALVVSAAGENRRSIGISSSANGAVKGEWHSRGDLKPLVSCRGIDL